MQMLKDFVGKYKWPLSVLAIVMVAAFFRFYQINKIPPGLFSDEAVNGINTLEANYTGNYKIFYTENNGREGLFINIQALSVKVFGNHAWALRVVSGLFGTLTVLFLYFLVKELFGNKRMAVFASFFLATSFWHMNFSRIGFRAIMAPFFLTAGTYLVWKLINELELGSLSSTWKRGFQVVLAGLVFGLGFHSYIAYRIAPLLLLPPLVIFIKNKKFKEVLLFILGMAIAVAPLALYFYQHPQDFLGRTSQISIFTADNPVWALTKNVVLTVGMFFVAGDFNWRHNYRGSPELFAPVAIFFLIGLIIAAYSVFKKDALLKERMANLFLYFWLGVMFLPVVISSEGLPHALRSIPLAPVAMIFAAIGLEGVIKKFNMSERAITTFTAFLFAMVISFTCSQYFTLWANKQEVADSFNKDATEAAYYLNSLPAGDPKYVIMESDNQYMPMSVNTVMFLTGSYLPEQQSERNINYLFKKDENLVPDGAAKIWIR